MPCAVNDRSDDVATYCSSRSDDVAAYCSLVQEISMAALGGSRQNLTYFFSYRLGCVFAARRAQSRTNVDLSTGSPCKMAATPSPVLLVLLCASTRCCLVYYPDGTTSMVAKEPDVCMVTESS